MGRAKDHPREVWREPGGVQGMAEGDEWMNAGGLVASGEHEVVVRETCCVAVGLELDV